MQQGNTTISRIETATTLQQQKRHHDRRGQNNRTATTIANSNRKIEVTQRSSTGT
jgi:hypothetical protein